MGQSQFRLFFLFQNYQNIGYMLDIKMIFLKFHDNDTIRNIQKGEINEGSFSNTDPWMAPR